MRPRKSPRTISLYEDGRIDQLVPEARRAWHAGVSSWKGATDINSHAIGIEIVNPGHEFGYRDFPDAQIDAVIALCRDIVTRHDIPPERVLAHSDVAPARKEDPGERFPWARLADAGIGRWIEPAPIHAGTTLKIGDRGSTVAELQRALFRFGYAADVTNLYDQATAEIVTAFQRHFRPARVDGIADYSTVTTLRRLLTASARAFLISPAKAPTSSGSVGRTAARANAERRCGRKVRAPWTYGAG